MGTSPVLAKATPTNIFWMERGHFQIRHHGFNPEVHTDLRRLPTPTPFRGPTGPGRAFVSPAKSFTKCTSEHSRPPERGVQPSHNCRSLRIWASQPSK